MKKEKLKKQIELNENFVQYAQIRDQIISELKQNNLSPSLISIFDNDVFTNNYYLVDDQLYVNGVVTDYQLRQIKDYGYDSEIGLYVKADFPELS